MGRYARQPHHRRTPRVLIGGIAHETNTFSLQPTTLADFQQRIFIGGRPLILGFGGSRTVVGGFLDGLETLDAEPVPLIYASATPGGVVTRAAYAALRTGLLDAVSAAGRVNGVLLALHGAMVTEDVQDAEADLLHAVRALVGADTPIIATLDSHANISPEMVAVADVLVGYVTYPHIDTYERGREAADLLGRLLRQPTAKTTRALAAPPMLVPLPPQCTSEETPMRALFARAAAHRADPRVLNITLAGGFPYSDVPDAGLRVVVTTANDTLLAAQIASDIAKAAWDQRAAFSAAMLSVDDAVKRVRTATATPLVLADSGDNPGAGAPCDGTVLLRALIAADVYEVALGVIADPETVAQAVAAGTGATIAVHLGGKTDDRHGTPIETAARIERITDGVFVNTGPMGAGSRTRMGRTALLAIGGVRVIVTEQRVQALDVALFRSVGIEPTMQRALVVKSSVHFRASFGTIAAAILDVDTPGISNPDLTRLTFRHLRRPIWPLDPNTPYDEVNGR